MSLLKKIIFALILFFIGMLTLNGMCALGERAAYGAFWGEDRPKGLYQHRNGERPQLRPGASLQGWLYQVSINSLGFRGPDLHSTKPENGKRIWCIGGSTTFDIFSSDDQSTWPAQTRKSLQQRFPEYLFEEINAGIPGEVLQGSLQDFERLQQDVQADYIVIYHGPNDMRQLFSTNRKIAANPQNQLGPPDPISSSILNRKDIALIRVLRRTLKIKQPLDPTWADTQIQNSDVQMLKNRVEHVIRIAKRNRTIPILASHAFRAQSGDTGVVAQKRVAETAQLLQMYPEAAIEAFDAYNAMLKDLSIKHRIPFADVRSALGPEEENWGDATHFRPKGSSIAGTIIADAIATTLERSHAN